MYWQVGIKINQECGQVTVHPQALAQSRWTNAIEHVMEMAQALYPDAKVEFDYIKEYDNV
jgi:hypothetical protein